MSKIVYLVRLNSVDPWANYRENVNPFIRLISGSICTVWLTVGFREALKPSLYKIFLCGSFSRFYVGLSDKK